MFLIKHSHRNSDDKGQQTLKVIHSELKIPNKFLVLPLNSCKLVQKYLKKPVPFIVRRALFGEKTLRYEIKVFYA